MCNHLTVQDIINRLGLLPHPEGGYFRETYRSDEQINRPNNEQRVAATGIYFLLPAEVCTHWHRVSSDELWHFYYGDKLMLEIIDNKGAFQRRVLGGDLQDGSYQELVPRHCWQRAYSTGKYSLMGCTVAPGFEFEDFEMNEAGELAKQFPDIAYQIAGNPFAKP